MKWVKSYESGEVQNVSATADIFPLRSRQVMFSYVVILCIVGGEMSKEDAGMILESMVVARN